MRNSIAEFCVVCYDLTRSEQVLPFVEADMQVESPARPGWSQWTFLTNHAHVLLCIVQSPTILMRDLATRVGITERAVQRIIGELEASGYLRTERHGRRNRYHVDTSLPLRHPLEGHRSIASLLKLVLEPPTFHPSRDPPGGDPRPPSPARSRPRSHLRLARAIRIPPARNPLPVRQSKTRTKSGKESSTP